MAHLLPSVYVFHIPLGLALASNSLQGAGVHMNKYKRVESKPSAVQKVNDTMTRVLMTDLGAWLTMVDSELILFRAGPHLISSFQLQPLGPITCKSTEPSHCGVGF